MGAYQPSEKYRISAFLTLSGGFLESYSYVTRNGVFANAQTGNIARLAMALARADFSLVIRYLIPITAFIAGVTLSMRLRSRLEKLKLWGLQWQQWIILLEIGLLLAVGLVPPEANDLFVTVTISFVCALQGESFRKFYGNAFASTMCTGNLRSATENMNYYYETRDRSFLHKGLMYFGIEFLFIAGVFVGYHATQAFSTRAVWCTPLLLSAVFFMMFHRGAGQAEAMQESEGRV